MPRYFEQRNLDAYVCPSLPYHHITELLISILSHLNFTVRLSSHNLRDWPLRWFIELIEPTPILESKELEVSILSDSKWRGDLHVWWRRTIDEKSPMCIDRDSVFSNRNFVNIISKWMTRVKISRSLSLYILRILALIIQDSDLFFDVGISLLYRRFVVNLECSSRALFCDDFYAAPPRDLFVLCCRGNLYSVWPLLPHSPLGPNMMMTDDWRHVSHTRFLDHNKKSLHTENWEEKKNRAFVENKQLEHVHRKAQSIVRRLDRRRKQKHRSPTGNTSALHLKNTFSNDEKWRIALTRITVWKKKPSLDDVITWTSRMFFNSISSRSDVAAISQWSVSSSR